MTAAPAGADFPSPPRGEGRVRGLRAEAFIIEGGVAKATPPFTYQAFCASLSVSSSIPTSASTLSPFAIR